MPCGSNTGSMNGAALVRERCCIDRLINAVAVIPRIVPSRDRVIPEIIG